MVTAITERRERKRAGRQPKRYTIQHAVKTTDSGHSTGGVIVAVHTARCENNRQWALTGGVIVAVPAGERKLRLLAALGRLIHVLRAEGEARSELLKVVGDNDAGLLHRVDVRERDAGAEVAAGVPHLALATEPLLA